MRRNLLLIIAVLLITAVASTAYAATFSEYWKQDGAGNWYVDQPGKGKVTNAWLCDDAVSENGKDVWYLLDADGNMLTAGLVQDGTGNCYSLETEHNGYYGMLRYQSGNYGGVNLTLEGSHNGSFAAILNPEGIETLKGKYGVTSCANINNGNIVYTSSFGKASGATGSGSASNGGAAGATSHVSSQEIINHLTRNFTGLMKASRYYQIDNSRPAWNNGLTNIKYIGPFDNDYHYNPATGENEPYTNCGWMYVYYADMNALGGKALTPIAMNEEHYLYADWTAPDGLYCNKYGCLEMDGVEVRHVSDERVMANNSPFTHWHVVYDKDGNVVTDLNNCNTFNIDLIQHTTLFNSYAFKINKWGDLVYNHCSGIELPAHDGSCLRYDN